MNEAFKYTEQLEEVGFSASQSKEMVKVSLDIVEKFATKEDLQNLESRMDIRFQKIDLKFKALDLKFEKLESKIVIKLYTSLTATIIILRYLERAIL